MIGRDALVSTLNTVVHKARSQATAVAYVSFSGLTRFANNQVHQNLHTHNIQVSLRAKIDNRIGVATTTGLDPDALEQALRRAEAIAQASPPVPNLPPLPGPKSYRYLATFVEATAAYTPQQRALSVKIILDMAKEAGAVASGLLSTGIVEMAVVNSIGLWSYAPLTAAELMTIIHDGPSSGYAAAHSRDVGEIDFEQCGRRALDKCQAGKKRVQVEPGDYEVVLEHAAVADALEWLSYIAFGSKGYEEGTSLLAGRKGQKIAQDDINVYDDGYEVRALGVPFDAEGMPKMRVDFIKNGVCKGCVHDTASAARSRTISTGHAMPPEERGDGAMPLNVVMAPGDGRLEDMIAGVKRGVLVTRFHYINGFIDTRNGVLTGMTRDGTYLIENGQLSAGLPNLRFMQSFVEAFNRVVQISADQKTSPAWWGAAGAFLTPALRISDFRFIGVQKED